MSVTPSSPYTPLYQYNELPPSPALSPSSSEHDMETPSAGWDDQELPSDHEDVNIDTEDAREFPVGSPFLTRAALRNVKATIINHIERAEVYLRLVPEARWPIDLAKHITDLNTLSIEFQRYSEKIPPPMFMSLLMKLRYTLESLDSLQNDIIALAAGGPGAPGRKWVYLQGGGRKLDISRDLLEEMCLTNFTDLEMAAVLRVCRRTILRRRKEWGLRKRSWSTISTEDLAMYLARMIKHSGPQEGEKGLAAGLRVLGIHVPRWQLRRAMDFVVRDPRMGPNPIIRRIYRVPWINSLWHMDGHHKLIRWKFVIHGCVDGYLRMVIFMQLADNNLADTVTAAFQEGVRQYGWPSRMRTDHGQENRGVMQLMENVRGSGRASHIMGSSTRNQRIERMWVDVQRWATMKYYRLFNAMEKERLIDIHNPFHIWALHIAYRPLIEWDLKFFVAKWNEHGIRTVRNNSPRRIWLKSIDPLRLPESVIDDHLLHIESLDDDLIRHAGLSFEDYGVDESGSKLYLDDEDPYVEVEPVLQRAPVGVREWLDGPQVRQHFIEQAGPVIWDDIEPGDGLFGGQRYLNVRAELDHQIRLRFPDLFADGDVM